MAKDTNQNNSNEGLDEDILQSRKDVLRAKDIIPSTPDSDSEQKGRKLPNEKTQKTQKQQIPKFDLTEQIMSKHRKATAVKRKAPGQKEDSKKTKRKTEPKYHLIPHRPKEPENKLIAEIVARDIRKLCKSN